MSAALDEADRFKAGQLPADPGVGTVRVPTAPGPSGRRLSPEAAAERALLGALMWSGSNAPALVRVEMVLDLIAHGDALTESAHRDVVAAMVACHAAGVEHEPVAVHAALVRAGKSGLGLDGLRRLVDEASTVSEAQAKAYAHTIRQAWVRRRIVTTARALANEAQDQKRSPVEVLSGAVTSLQSLGADVSSSGHFVSIKEALTAYFERLQSMQAAHWSTGLRDLDQAIVGLFPKEVSVVAARTSVGKSSLAATMALGLVERSQDAIVLYVSLEMHASLFCGRLAAARAGIPAKALRRENGLSQEQWKGFTTAVGELAPLGIYFVDSTTQTMQSILGIAEEIARKLARENKRIALIVVDHVGLVKPSVESSKRDSRERQVAEVSRGLRYLAERFDCHVMALAQINRAAEDQKADTRVPKLRHLAESDSIGRDADVVIIVHRDQDKLTGLLDTEKPAGIVVAKQRNDEPTALLLTFDAPHVTFRNYDGDRTFSGVYGGPNG